MDIALIAQEKINKFVTDGTLDQLIESQIKKTLESTVNDVFRDYSEFGRSLKETLSEKLKINLAELSIPTYSNTICKLIEDTLVATSLEPSLQKIKQIVDSSLNQLEKKTWKLSEIIRKYIKNDYTDKDATYNVSEPEYTSYWVNIDKVESSSYNSGKELRLLVDSKTNVINNVWFKNKSLNGLNVNKIYSFEMFLMQLWINNCVLEVDDDESDEACIREHECHC